MGHKNYLLDIWNSLLTALWRGAMRLTHLRFSIQRWHHQPLANWLSSLQIPLTGDIADSVRDRFETVLSKNPGYRDIWAISSAQIDSSTTLPPHLIQLSPQQIATYKYAPITTVDVERQFSKYKHLLSPRRMRFTREHLFQFLSIQCNSSILAPPPTAHRHHLRPTRAGSMRIRLRCLAIHLILLISEYWIENIICNFE